MSNQGAPFYYDYINAQEARNPQTIQAGDAIITRFFTRYLIQKAISVFKWDLPDTWARNFLLYCLYCYGFVAVFKTDKFGTIFQPCGLRGYDVFYRPTHAVIANPLLRGNIQPRIGQECELLRLQPDYGGIMDIVQHYANMMAIATETAEINLFNSKLSYVFWSDNKAGAATFEKLYENISMGKPASVVGKEVRNADGSTPWELFLQNVGQNYIADRVLADLRKIESMYDTDIGIPNANTEKRERLITDEVNANNIETLSKCSLWLQELKESCEKINAMFGLALSVDWRYTIDGGGSNGSGFINSRTTDTQPRNSQ